MTAFHDPDAGRALSRYLGLDLLEVTPGPDELPIVEGRAPAPPWLRDERGEVHPGAVLTLADSAAGLCGGLAALPGWVVTTNLAHREVRTVPPGPAVGPLVARAAVARAGRNAVVTTYTIRDEGRDDTLIGDGALTSSVLQPEGGAPSYPRPLHLASPVHASALPGWDAFLGIERNRDGTAVLVPSREVANPWGIVHGGALAALVDAAAAGAVTAARATAVRTTDVVLHYLSPARVGPIGATGTVLGRRRDGWVVRVEARDHGAGERLTTMGVASVRPT